MAHLLESIEQFSGYHASTGHSWKEDIPEESHPYHIENLFWPSDREPSIDLDLIPEASLHYIEIGSFSPALAWVTGGQYRKRHFVVPGGGGTPNSTENLHQRLANANDYFRRKASEVFNDKVALGLLDTMYRGVVVDISQFDACENGIPLAKLTAANFCEVGAKVIYITEAGQRFIDSLRAYGRG